MIIPRQRTPRSAPLREILAFLLVVFALALSLAVGLPHAHLNVPLSALLPTVAVTILTFTLFPRGTRRDLWRSFGLRRAGLRSWGWALAVPILLCGAAFGAALLVGAGHLQELHLSEESITSFAIDLAANVALMLVLFTGEEIGWRGYLLPRVQQLTTRRRAAVLTGFAHGCFHLPLILIATTYDADGPRWVAAPLAVLTITAAGVFYAWLKDRSGTVWPVTIGHTFANLTFAWGFAVVASTTPTSLACVAGETGVATFGVVVVAAIVILTNAKVWKTHRTDDVTRAADAPSMVAAVR